jgi:N6-L-threonylcarbamoyladenine synthase
MAREADSRGIRLLYPPMELCTDNAAMIASAGFFRLERGERSPFDLAADPSLPLR